MHKLAREDFRHQVSEHEADGTLEEERQPIGSPYLYYNRRPPMVVDVDILVAVHDSIEHGAGADLADFDTYDRYRSTLNI